jgi:hypothetical protein
VSANIRLRAALCLALSLVNSAKARADEPQPPPHTNAPPAAAALAPARDEDPCAEHAKMVASWLAATRDVRAAERAIDAIEANPVLASREGCSGAAISAGRCSDLWYSREEELERAKGRLAAAEENVTSVEESARVAGVPMVCLVDPSE